MSTAFLFLDEAEITLIRNSVFAQVCQGGDPSKDLLALAQRFDLVYRNRVLGDPDAVPVKPKKVEPEPPPPKRRGRPAKPKD